MRVSRLVGRPATTPDAPCRAKITPAAAAIEIRTNQVGSLAVQAAVGFIVLLIIVILIASAASKAGRGGYDWLVANGIPARGILLQVSALGTKTGTVARRFEVRSVYIDVEVPGKPPYETAASPLIPVNLVRDVLPGATVELRVDPKDPTKMAIVGPGTGFVQQALRTTS
jgi:hypothetical protein